MKSIIKNTIISIIVCLLTTPSLGASLFTSLFSDHRSFAVGDILTVQISETSRASASSQTTTDRNQRNNLNLNAGQGALGFIPMAGMGSNISSNSNGKADTKRDASLTSRMTVTIIDIDERGNLVIEGTRVVKINGEDEITTLTGRVRSQDIGANNTIHSHNIADAVISYSGKGAVADASKVGILTRFWNMLF